MAATIALVVYYLLAILAMAGALYLWRDLSLNRIRSKFKALSLKHAKDIETNAAHLQTLETERAEERRRWIGEFQHAREHLDRLRHELAEARSGSLARWNAYKEMQQVWHPDSGATEEEAKALLRNYMWVLEPEFSVVDVDKVEWEVSLPNALAALYGPPPLSEARVWREPPDESLKIDIAAVVSMVGALGTPRTHAGEEALLLIEAKRPGSTGVLNEAAREQVLSYAANLRKLRPDILMGRRIECLLIGGRIPDRMNDIVVKWDSEGEAPTMVRFLTWETLLTRAERACQALGPRPGSKPRFVEPQTLAAQ